MRSKPADLSASLVVVKGAAAPSPDMPGRAGAPATVALPPPVPTAPAPRTKTPRPGSEQSAAKEANLTPLNFRISATFRREFRTYAATHDLKLNELLRLCFEAYRRQHRD
jgi:hypothetical protein